MQPGGHSRRLHALDVRRSSFQEDGLQLQTELHILTVLRFTSAMFTVCVKQGLAKVSGSKL